MIIDAIVEVLLGVLTGVLGLLPAYELPGSIDGVAESLAGSVAGVNGVFPVVTLGLAMGALLTFRLMLWAVSVVQWVYELIPFKAS